MTFSLQQGVVIKSSQITHTQSSNIHPLAHILDTYPLMFSSSMYSFHSLSQQHHVTASHPSPVITPEHGRAVRKNTGPSKNGSVKLIQLYMYQGSPLFSILRALSRIIHVIPLLHKATFNQSVQPNIGLPRTRPHLLPSSTPFRPCGTRPFFQHAQTTQ